MDTATMQTSTAAATLAMVSCSLVPNPYACPGAAGGYGDGGGSDGTGGGEGGGGGHVSSVSIGASSSHMSPVAASGHQSWGSVTRPSYPLRLQTVPLPCV